MWRFLPKQFRKALNSWLCLASLGSASCADGGLNAMYRDGLIWSGNMLCAQRLQGRLADIAIVAFFQGSGAQTELRRRLTSGVTPGPHQLGFVIED
jgi:hypothetical protein